MRPIRIPRKIEALIKSSGIIQDQIGSIKKDYSKLRKTHLPEVSIVIPAYNEEKNILSTLHSLAANTTTKAVEILVINNNSSDSTEDLVLATGISCILETRQGITAARNAGLKAASGKFILNADADAIYPENWIDEMIDPLAANEKLAITYGRFSFIPVGNTKRWMYFLYEHAADVLRYINKYFKEEAVNVYGFNSGYRRTQGLAVEGYNHPVGANEDGYLALKLRNSGFGKLHYVTAAKALVWTTDRRIQSEGGFMKGINKRIKKFLFPQRFTQLRTDL